MSNAELLELPCDVLVLAATENQVTGANAASLQTKLVAEGANGPTSLEGDEILAERGIPVLPDILTNAGGVAVSYFEWVQDIQRLFWGPDEIRSRLADLMADALSRVWDLSESEGASVPARRPRHEHPRGRRGARGARHPPVIVREALMADPRVLQASASAREAAELLTHPHVSSVLVADGEQLVGCIGAESIVAAVAKGSTSGRRPPARSPTPTSSRSRPTCRSTRRSTAWPSSTSSACPSPTTAACSASLAREPIARRLAEDEPPAPLEES